jgi:DNA ligase (NAD+)
LGIRFVGEQTAKHLASKFKTLDRFLKAEEEDLLAVEEIGPKVAKSILEALDQNSFLKNINELLKNGIEIEENAATDGVLSGLTFVITGSLPVSRPEAQRMIESYGGKCGSAVTKKTDYVVVGEDAGSKLEKAQKLGLKILDWDQLQDLIKT